MAARKQKMEVAVFFAFEQFVQPDFLLRISQIELIINLIKNLRKLQTELHDYKYNPLFKFSEKSCGSLLKKLKQRATIFREFSRKQKCHILGVWRQGNYCIWGNKTRLFRTVYNPSQGGSKAKTARKLFLPTAVYSLKWTYIEKIRNTGCHLRWLES